MAKLDLNLSHRPFVNLRPLNVAVVVIGVILAVATFVNVFTTLGALARYRTLAARAAHDEAALARGEERARMIGDTIDPLEARRIRRGASALKAVIQQRRLSWSRLFDQLAAALPADVRILSVRPGVSDSGIDLVMEATAKNNEAKLDFYRRLNETPFRDAVLMSEQIEPKMIRFAIRCEYDPDAPGVATVAPEAPASDPPGGGAVRRAAAAPRPEAAR